MVEKWHVTLLTLRGGEAVKNLPLLLVQGIDPHPELFASLHPGDSARDLHFPTPAINQMDRMSS